MQAPDSFGQDALAGRAPELLEPAANDDIFSYLSRVTPHDPHGYARLLGAASAFKEGDVIIGVAAASEASRQRARHLLANTSLAALRPVFTDDLEVLIRNSLHAATVAKVASWTVGHLKAYLLSATEEAIKQIMPGLHSDVIAAVVKLMSNAELIQVSAKVFNPLPNSRVGARGYLGARLQPNSPTDNPDDIRWQVFNGFAFATGDVLLGTNPVDGRTQTVHLLERTLRDIVETFHLQNVLPWCVLAHVDAQAQLLAQDPSDVALVFQSLAGNDAANQTFGISVDKMLGINRQKAGPYGFYYETGQGADFTNGAHHGTDMVVHEARKYGFVRALNQVLGADGRQVWTIVNDVAGFIGPEVFRTPDQLIRCCLEDLLMAKLHGLCMGHDVCATLHMDVGLRDLERCLEALMPANPAYLMALPTRNDPMLSYLTTAFQDHVRLRERFGYKINDAMARFFHAIDVLDAEGHFTTHAGDPFWVYYQYRRAQGDNRTAEAIMAEGRAQGGAVMARGVPLAIGHGVTVSDMTPALRANVEGLYADAKACLHIEFNPTFFTTVPQHVVLDTMAQSRDQFVAKPAAGEVLPLPVTQQLEAMRAQWQTPVDVQIVVSDGLNAAAIMDPQHLAPLLQALPTALAGLHINDTVIFLRRGRVRAGYAIGKTLFGDAASNRMGVLLNVIGERPGTPHHNYSIYVAALTARDWATDRCDHDVVRVVSGISDTALKPHDAAQIVRSFLKTQAA